MPVVLAMQLRIPIAERYPVIKVRRQEHQCTIIMWFCRCSQLRYIWPEEAIVIVQHTPLVVPATMLKETPLKGGIMPYSIDDITAYSCKILFCCFYCSCSFWRRCTFSENVLLWFLINSRWYNHSHHNSYTPCSPHTIVLSIIII